MAAWVSGDASLAEGAEALCEGVLASQAVFPYRTAVARLGLALLAIQKGDPASASQQYTALRTIPDMMLLYMSKGRALGLLASTMGNLDQAASHFEESITLCRRAGYRPELAWTYCDYAETLLKRDGPADKGKAMLLLEESLALSSELGMRPLNERATTLHERSSSGPLRSLAYPDGLTQREVEVLRLVAAGKTDREIAENLTISVRTVATHVGNILRKTNAANRTEAASYANRQGLV